MSVKYYNGKFDAYQRTYIINSEKYFSYIYLYYKKFILDISNAAKGSVIKFLTKSMLEDIEIPILSELEMIKFEENNIFLLDYIENIKKENNKLIELKKLYLNKFFK